MYNIYCIEKLNPAGETCEEYIEAENAKKRDDIIKDIKKNPDIIEIRFCRIYADGEPGTIKKIFTR